MRRRILTVPKPTHISAAGVSSLLHHCDQIRSLRRGARDPVLAGFTDGLDGLLARGLNQRTPLGAYLDPIADKLLLSSSYLVLALKGKIAWWLAIMVLGRDVLLLVACAVILLTVGYRPFPPSIWGKATTFFEIFLIVLVLVLAVWANESLWIVRDFSGYIVGALVIFSGLHYSIVVSRELQTG